MNRSQLIDRLAAWQPELTVKDAELAVKAILAALSSAVRRSLEIRGFGASA
jgi:integration host factor subunit beta